MIKNVLIAIILVVSLNMKVYAVRVSALQECLEEIKVGKEPAGVNKNAKLEQHLLKNASKIIYLSTPQVLSAPSAQTPKIFVQKFTLVQKEKK